MNGVSIGIVGATVGGLVVGGSVETLVGVVIGDSKGNVCFDVDASVGGLVIGDLDGTLVGVDVKTSKSHV